MKLAWQKPFCSLGGQSGGMPAGVDMRYCRNAVMRSQAAGWAHVIVLFLGINNCRLEVHADCVLAGQQDSANVRLVAQEHVVRVQHHAPCTTNKQGDMYHANRRPHRKKAQDSAWMRDTPLITTTATVSSPWQRHSNETTELHHGLLTFAYERDRGRRKECRVDCEGARVGPVLEGDPLLGDVVEAVVGLRE